MRRKLIYIVPHKHEWTVKREKNPRAVRATRTKRKAFEIGRRLAKSNKVELVTHNRKGQIIDKDSYSRAPYPLGDERH